MPFRYARAQMVLVWLRTKDLFKDYCASEAGLPGGILKHRLTNGVPDSNITRFTHWDLCS
jgi:hypothetical protein